MISGRNFFNITIKHDLILHDNIRETARWWLYNWVFPRLSIFQRIL